MGRGQVWRVVHSRRPPMAAPPSPPTLDQISEEYGRKVLDKGGILLQRRWNAAASAFVDQEVALTRVRGDPLPLPPFIEKMRENREMLQHNSPLSSLQVLPGDVYVPVKPSAAAPLVYYTSRQLPLSDDRLVYVSRYSLITGISPAEDADASGITGLEDRPTVMRRPQKLVLGSVVFPEQDSKRYLHFAPDRIEVVKKSDYWNKMKEIVADNGTRRELRELGSHADNENFSAFFRGIVDFIETLPPFQAEDYYPCLSVVPDGEVVYLGRCTYVTADMRVYTFDWPSPRIKPSPERRQRLVKDLTKEFDAMEESNLEKEEEDGYKTEVQAIVYANSFHEQVDAITEVRNDKIEHIAFLL